MVRVASRWPISARRIGERGLSLNISLLRALFIGALGGVSARALGLPLPYLLGALSATGAVAFSGRVALALPPALRLGFLPVIGVAIGGAFTPAGLADMRHWGPSALALCLFIPLAHWLGYRLARAMGGGDPLTVYLGAAPGGMVETVQIGEALGADLRLLTLMQFLRLVLTVILVPLGFWLITGHAVGSAGGAGLAGSSLSGASLSAVEAVWLIAAGLLGAALARRIALPAGMISLPMALSAALHLSGWVSGGPPAALVASAQIVIGTALGLRFMGAVWADLAAALRLALWSTGSTLILALLFAVPLAKLVNQPVAAVFLAFAPGGLTEMALIALSLHMSVVYVTAHHLLRIVLAVWVAQIGARRIARQKA